MGVYFTWQKGVSLKLSTHFNTGEFNCQCSYLTCREQRIAKELVEKLELIRTTVGPLTITSGYRCGDHQRDLIKDVNLKTVSNSQHMLGNAADIKASDMKLLREQAELSFDALGISKTFIHVDLRNDKKRSWTY